VAAVAGFSQLSDQSPELIQALIAERRMAPQCNLADSRTFA
jgi:hypothetical protein